MEPRLQPDMPHVPPQASTAAPWVDSLLLVITLVSVFFAVGIVLAILYFVARYRRGRNVDRSHGVINHLPIEATWTLIPLAIALGIFIWGAVHYLRDERVPAGSTPIYVIGKQWMWKVQHPEGRAEINQLHVPMGRPIVLILSSEDVIHSFFVPAFRLKQDAIPGQYTRLPFTATRPGIYHLFCSEFCGTFHSNMTGTVTVMQPADYQRWLQEGAESGLQEGERLFRNHGCSGCHMGGSVRAPRLEGIYGNLVAVQYPRPGVPLERVEATTVVADEQYLHDSITLAEKAIVAGYRPIMPSYRNRISEAEIFQMVSYLRSLGDTDANYRPEQGQRERLTPEEYRARTGFTPSKTPGQADGPGEGGER